MINLSQLRIWILLAVLSGSVLYVDTTIPLGFSSGVLYVPVIVLLTLISRQPKNAYLLAGLATSLTALGYWLSPQSFHSDVALANRVVAISIIWMTAFLVSYVITRMHAQRMETRYKAAWEMAEDAVLVTNDHGKILDLNPAAQKLFAIDPGHKGRLEDYFGSCCKADNVVFSELLQQLLYATNNRIQAQSRNKRTFPAHVSLSVFQDGTNELCALTVRDLTEAQESELALLKAKNAAEASSRAKATFLASMNHEIRTPLNAIIGFSQLLSMDKNSALDDDQKDYVKHITNSGNHMMRLVSSVFDLAKIEVGQLHISIETISVREVLDQCVNTISEAAKERSISITADYPPFSLMVKADFTRLLQCLINLATNAIKYNREGGDLKISVSPDPEGGQVRFVVSDNGIGIPKEMQEHLFEPFNRLGLEGGTIEGSGIGLALTRHLVILMNGDIGLSSESGHGSTFWISLPIADEQLLQTEPELLVHDAMPTDDASTVTVLYIEDNLTNQAIMKALFDNIENIKLVMLMSAEEALQYLETHSPHLILMDINLPKMNGLDACKILKQKPSTAGIPVIAVSADATKRNIDLAKAVGIETFISKPFDILKTQETILSTLKH